MFQCDSPRVIYISQLIHFARLSSLVSELIITVILTAQLLKQGYKYHTLRSQFSAFYRLHSELMSTYNVSLKIILLEGFSEPEFDIDTVYKLRTKKVELTFFHNNSKRDCHSVQNDGLQHCKYAENGIDGSLPHYNR